ncbi:MAG: glycosyltransferase family 2 protein [Sphingobacteriaceae bacterium]|nr:glycosyltransferase family 2 protein [Sphingobacteriaceae bacterium]
MNKNILIIIPCYNEEGNVRTLYQKIKEIEIPHCRITPLFINDYSSDNTLKVLDEMDVNYLDNPINLRIGGTVQTGFLYAWEYGYDIAVQMDGDGQHPPKELSKLIRPLLNDEADVVIGSRFIQKEGFQSSVMRRFGIKFFTTLNKMLVGITIHDSTSGYRAYNKKAIQLLTEYYPDEYPEPEAIIYLSHKKMKLLEIPVIMDERVEGVSSIGSFNSLYYMIKVSLNSLFLHLKLKLNG